ncbi:hypothetical protein OXX79_002670 [Metschnikowia pulcherrima]
MSKEIPAFIDGNTFVHYDQGSNRLYVGNAEGVLKVFNPDEPDSEPVPLDIPEFLTSLKSFGNKVALTNTEGRLVIFDLGDEITGDEDYSEIYKSSFPLRDVEIINEGNRIIFGGDNNNIMIADLSQENKVDEFPLADKLVNISYNSLGELVALTLANGEVHIYSVFNEKPELVESIKGVTPPKANTSLAEVHFLGSNAHELPCTRSIWSSNGEHIFVPTMTGSVKAFNRSEWSSNMETPQNSEMLVATTISPNNKYVALLHKNGTIKIYDLETLSLIRTLDNNQPAILSINLAWARKTLYVGATSGSFYSFDISLDNEKEAASEITPAISEVDKLFLEEASDSETEDPDAHPEVSRKRDALDDSRMIDEDDDDEQEEDPYRYHNKKVDDILENRRKKARFSSPDTVAAATRESLVYDIIPYSPGSTPWFQSATSGSSSTKRRYLFMNSIGYAWSVKNASDDSSDIQKSMTISFFDRSMNKDYHFLDYYDYDLCSMNERGILLGCSGHRNESSAHKGRVFYRHHVNTSDSWERQIPLLQEEHITSICITSSSAETSGDSIIVVGTSHGYLRFFNLYGLCINIMKVSPVISLVSSALNTVLSGALDQGLFFNDHSDPCLVAGHDDTLVVLSHWREPGNARWVPLLNCTDAISDFGLSESKKNWKCWPLGLQGDRSVCLILKNNDIYPGFPLPLPIELDLRLPTKCFKSLLKGGKEAAEEDDDEFANGDDEIEKKLQKVKEEDPEEEYLRVTTLGRLLASSLSDLGEEEEHMETLKSYSLIFDKSLLKLFNSACQESRLNKAFSVAKLIKNDKALLAASKIAERHNFANLMAKITKLREDLLDMSEVEEDE